jgi:hypothetical protein
MDPSAEWCPMRWPEGEHWRKPDSLELVRNSPVNCVVLPWSAEPGRAAAWRPLVEAGRKAGLSFAGWLEPGAERGAAVEQAKAAGLDAVAAEGPPGDSQALPLIPVAERSKLPWKLAGAIVATTEGVWPSVKSSRAGGDSADAGPTGLPWIDSNGWLARLAGALAPEKVLWLGFVPPEKLEVRNGNSYLLAVADSRAYGARWIVALDKGLSDGLASGEARFRDSWKQVVTSLEFFEKHREWRRYVPAGALAVMSDFAGDNEFLAGEALNLLGRRQLPHCIVEKSSGAAQPLDRFKAVLYPDPQPPAPELRRRLLDFVRGGGLLIVQASLREMAGGAQASGQTHSRFDVRALGKGRMAVAKEEISDPYLLAADAHLLMSRRNDLYRMWNSGAVGTDYSVSPDNRKALFQMVNYSGGPASFLTVRFERRYSRARLWTLEGAEPRDVEMVVDGDRAEFRLPAIFVYAALELEAEA